MERGRPNRVGRREFLRASGVGLAGLAVAGLPGCDTGGPQQATKKGRRAFAGTELELRGVFKEGYELEAIQRFKGDFEKATGIKLKMEVYDEPTAREKFVLDATSQTGTYDVTSGSFWNMPEWVNAGWIEPLNDYIENKRDPGWLVPDNMPKTAAEALTYDGILFALPHTMISGTFYYRKDIFDKHGIQPPQATDEILAAARKFEEAEPGMAPFTGRGAPTFASLGTDLGWAYGYGSLLYDEQNQPHADSPEMLQAMEDFVSLMKEFGPSDAASLTFTEAGEKFSSGRAAMMFDTSGFGTIFENPELSKVAGKVGYTLPTGPTGNTLQWLYAEGVAISAFSKNKEAAWLFLQWRLSEETMMKELLEIARTDVPNLAVLGSQEYKDYAEKQGITEFTKILPESWESAVTEHWPFYPQFARIGDTFCAHTSGAIAGEQSVEAALGAAQQELEQLEVTPVRPAAAE